MLRIAAFPFHDWRKADEQGVRWRDGHLIEALAARPEVEVVLVIDRPTSRTERLVRRTSYRPRGDLIAERRSGSAIGGLTPVAPGITTLDVAVRDLVAPARDARAWWFDIFRRREVLELIEWGTGLLIGARPPTIAWTPTVAPAIERLDPQRFVFDSLDNWISHPQLRRHADRAARAYATLLPRADLVLVSGPRSRDVLSPWSKRIEVVPNAVAPETFSVAQTRPPDLPPPPIVGYAGTLGPRLDEGFIVEVARRLRDVSFVFIGQDPSRRLVDAIAGRRVRFGLNRRSGSLHTEPNVLMLGDRHYSRVPAYVQAFDIGWIPHAVGEGESGGDPIKMYEYWAAGREVIATPIDGLDRWPDRLHLVNDAAEAARTIDGLLNGSIAPKHATVPPDRTWKAIADRMIRELSATA